MTAITKVSTDELLMITDHLVTLGRLASCADINLYVNRKSVSKFGEDNGILRVSMLMTAFEFPRQDILIVWRRVVCVDSGELHAESFKVVEATSEFHHDPAGWITLEYDINTIEEAWKISKANF